MVKLMTWGDIVLDLWCYVWWINLGLRSNGVFFVFWIWILSDMDVGQEDLSQVFTLASIWVLFLAIGSSACVVPIIYTIGLAYQDAFNSGLSHDSYLNQAPALEFLATVNGILFMFFGSLVGFPIASASGKFNISVWGCESFKKSQVVFSLEL